MSLDSARAYLAFPHLEPELRAELEPLLKAAEAGDAKAAAELEDRFSEPLAFGTGGLRGFMAAGLRRMNRPNVRRATLGLAAVAQRRAPGKKVAVVGYDTRINSDVFAAESAAVLAAAGYQVFLGTRPLPTPFLCFAMRRLDAACGAIVTASHNPKEYNGFKAYNDLGGQVVEPWDVEVEAHMAGLPLVPEPPVAPAGRIQPIPAEVEEAYLAMGQDLLQRPSAFEAARILYTPFHGTGIAFVPALFKRAGLPLAVSPSQGVQDGTFPTAPRPNPEELAAYAAPLKEAEAMGAEAARYGILVVTVLPGLMRTGSFKRALVKGQRRAEASMFSLAASLPLLTVSAAGAARRIVRAVEKGETQGFMKIVVDAQTREILGARRGERDRERQVESFLGFRPPTWRPLFLGINELTAPGDPKQAVAWIKAALARLASMSEDLAGTTVDASSSSPTRGRASSLTRSIGHTR